MTAMGDYYMAWIALTCSLHIIVLLLRKDKRDKILLKNVWRRLAERCNAAKSSR